MLFALPVCGPGTLPMQCAVPNCSLVLGFAVGVQQLHPTLIQRTYG